MVRMSRTRVSRCGDLRAKGRGNGAEPLIVLGRDVNGG
jgi:hypothetical protein